jgi:hypothetical protein
MLFNYDPFRKFTHCNAYLPANVFVKKMNESDLRNPALIQPAREPLKIGKV